jgi:hypothetical protein
METTIDKLYDILIEVGINKKTIEKKVNLILFTHKKIMYFVQIEGDDEFNYGPSEFENGALDSDYLEERYGDYGSIVDFEDFAYSVVNDNLYTKLYSITDKLLKIEEEAENCDVDFEALVNHMFPN